MNLARMAGRSLQTFWVALLSFACGPDSQDGEGADEVDPLGWSVLEPGIFGVGHRLTETTHTDPMGISVTIPIDIWYPTDATAGEPAVYFGVVEDPQSFSEVAPSEPVHRDGYPVLVFSHGSNLYGGSSAYLMRHFASHGWIAVAPTHVGNTMTEFGGGDCESEVASCRSMDVWVQRPHNTMAALDALSNDETLGDKANTDAVVLAGFSYGAYDAWARIGGVIARSTIVDACEENAFDGGCTEDGIDALATNLFDERVVAAIPIAGAHAFPFEANGRAGLSTPVMQISGTADDDNPQWVWDNSANTSMDWVSIEAGCHQMFSLGGCSQIDAEDGFDMVEAYSFAFARHHLLADDSEQSMGLLDGTTQPWEAVTIKRK